jgi:glycosyltransferase involved in cell wall biosynthesis
MMIAPWHDVVTGIGDLRQSRTRLSFNPKVSVIIPAWNEEVGLLATVKTVLASTYQNLEVIVVNDGSTDDSDRIMREFELAYNIKSNGVKDAIRLKYFYKENAGKGRALNYGINQSSGDIIISIDADCALLPQTVGNFVKHFASPNGGSR